MRKVRLLPRASYPPSIALARGVRIGVVSTRSLVRVSTRTPGRTSTTGLEQRLLLSCRNALFGRLAERARADRSIRALHGLAPRHSLAIINRRASHVPHVIALALRRKICDFPGLDCVLQLHLRCRRARSCAHILRARVQPKPKEAATCRVVTANEAAAAPPPCHQCPQSKHGSGGHEQGVHRDRMERGLLLLDEPCKRVRPGVAFCRLLAREGLCVFGREPERGCVGYRRPAGGVGRVGGAHARLDLADLPDVVERGVGALAAALGDALDPRRGLVVGVRDEVDGGVNGRFGPAQLDGKGKTDSVLGFDHGCDGGVADAEQERLSILLHRRLRLLR
mmetsp:Transcript_14704/g.28765  ORF Transcript_14704/g.28765 Transcript_14704/m.28765 type:complete len:337 (+) Transcript_14704:311-1321(+)